MPMVIFSSVRLGVTPEINALATVIIVLVTSGIITAGVIMGRHERRRERDRQLAEGADNIESRLRQAV